MRIDICNSETLKKLKGGRSERLYSLTPSVILQRTGGASVLSLTMLSCSVGTDKAGGKKFSKDFEEGSAQLQEFIKFYSSHCKTGAPLMQALGNADIFYEMQYKEVKIVANVSDTRVSGQKVKPEMLDRINVDHTTRGR